MAKLVASIFNEYLSVLFEDFSSKNVNSKLFTGKINIQNVRVLYGDPLVLVFPEWRRKKNSLRPAGQCQEGSPEGGEIPTRAFTCTRFQPHALNRQMFFARSHTRAPLAIINHSSHPLFFQFQCTFRFWPLFFPT